MRTLKATLLMVLASATVFAAPGFAASGDVRPTPTTSAPDPEFTFDKVDTTSLRAVADNAAGVLYDSLWKTNSDDLAGVWVDSGDPHIIHVTTTSKTAAALIPAVASGLGIDSTLRLSVEVVAHSAKVLRSTSMAIGEANADLAAKGVVATAWADDAPNDRVRVWVDSISAPDAAQVLRSLYGDFVDVQRSEQGNLPTADRWTDYPSLRAGQAITQAFGSERCTAGPNVQSTHSGSYYVLSAGHCDSVGNQATWEMGNNTAQAQRIGSTGTNLAPSGAGGTSNCDCLAIGPLTSRQANNVVYTSPTTGVNLTGSCGQYCLGGATSVCFSGASTATNPVHCGTLNAYSAGCNYSPPDVPLNGVGWANDVSVRGDSGGIAYQGSRAVGIISGNCAGHLAFSWIDVAEQRIAVTTLTFDPS